MCIGVWKEREESDESEKAVEEAASGLANRAYLAEVVQRPCLWLPERFRVRGHGSPHWNNSSSAAWDPPIYLLYYLYKGDSSFNTLFLSQQARNMLKQDRVKDNQGNRSRRHKPNFQTSCNLKNFREPCGKEQTGNTNSEPTPATLFFSFPKLLKTPGLWKSFVLHLYWLSEAGNFCVLMIQLSLT